MQTPDIGKKYKHYKGDVYTVVDVSNDVVSLIKGNSMYNIGLDFWNTPVVSENHIVSNRFTKCVGRKTK